MASESFTIALAGNPNAGKSTIFNALTGSHQHVGNWPGKTVEKKEGHLSIDGLSISLIDLPGIYSMNAFSAEEVIARNFITDEKPDAVISVVDAANLERNLYLVTQIIEMDAPLILVLNMTDVAKTRGISIDKEGLSQRLGGVPIIETIGSREIGFDELRQAILGVAKSKCCENHLPSVLLHDAVEAEIHTLRAVIAEDKHLTEQYCPRWLAIKLLENDPEILDVVQGHTNIIAAHQEASDRIEAATGEEADTLIADGRYKFIASLVNGVVARPANTETASDRIDAVLTHRWFGIPIFMLLMWIVFQITANVSAPLLDWVDGIISGPITHWATALFSVAGISDTWLADLVINGIIAGVGGVLVFVPVLMSLYLAIGVLEDSGYMARAAFVMDRAMQSIGLHGNSFLPMLVGFGCTVPGIYATRTLEDPHDRKVTGFLVHFMSCGARLPVYVIFGAAFFGANAGALIFSMYILGIVIAILTSLLLTRGIYRNRPAPLFVMEMPPYRLPTARNIWYQMWTRTEEFIRKAWTIILVTSIILWFLMAIPISSNAGGFNDVAPEDSLFGATSKVIAPVFAPAGFGEWQASGALLTGFIAKEVVVSTMNQIYIGEDSATANEDAPTLIEDVTGIVTSLGQAVILTGQEFINIVPNTVNLLPGINIPEANFLSGETTEESTTELENALTRAFTPLAAVAFVVFILLYVPCMVSVSAMRQEFGTRWMLTQILYTLGIAWVAAVLVFQVGSLLGY